MRIYELSSIKTKNLARKKNKKMNILSPALLTIFILLTSIACIKVYHITRKDLVEKKLSEKERKKHIYIIAEPYAENFKAALQMIIGFGLTVLLTLKLIHHLLEYLFLVPAYQGMLAFARDTFLSKYVYHQPTIAIVGFALAYSTAVELAYTLFTSGPDEAINPLILGLSATILIILSNTTNFDVNKAVGFTLLVAVLAGLFIFSKKFVDKSDEEVEPHKAKENETDAPNVPISVQMATLDAPQSVNNKGLMKRTFSNLWDRFK